MELQWVVKSQRFQNEKSVADAQRKMAELTRAREIAEREKQLREAAELQQQLAKRRSQIAIRIALLALIASVIAGWQYQEAITAKNKAQASEEKTKQVLDKIYFYDDKFGLAYDKESKKYGFIDPNLNTKIKFEYDEASSFAYYGFAEVKKYMTDSNYLIDTIGNEYKLATDINLLDSTITALDLSNKNLNMIPLSVFKHPQLKVLLIHRNQIKNLSPNIGRMNNLQMLNLSSNKLTSLPIEFGNLANLEWLDLQHNQLSSLPVEVGNLVNLQLLNLYTNQLTSLPIEFSRLKNLQLLALGINQLTSLPIGFDKLTNLQLLVLSRNPISITEQDKIKKRLPNCEIQF